MIVSVSRRTDIPAHYAEWFFNRLQDGYATVRNPMNSRQLRTVSLLTGDVDCFVFWSKNPKPMLPMMGRLDGYPYYFQFTLNAYGAEVEPDLPETAERIETFRACSDRIERVVWRYDPIFFNDRYTADWHIESFAQLAEDLAGYTERVTISFLTPYKKIAKNTRALAITQPDADERQRLVLALSAIAGRNGMRLDTCAQADEWSAFGVAHARCIDPVLIEQLTGRALTVEKDTLRPACGCAASVDIGAYDTCPACCLYCYANHSRTAVEKNTAAHRPDSPILIGRLTNENNDEKPPE